MKNSSKELDREFRKTIMSMYVFLYLAVYAFCGAAQFQLHGTFPDILAYTREIICDTDRAFADRLNVFFDKVNPGKKPDSVQQITDTLTESVEQH